ncbi:MAG: hypothetical protein AB1772_04860 [Candidatus Zixiibacteriota bacterium]
MVVATRLMNLISGVLILASGAYIELGFEAVLSDISRLVIASAALMYFIWRLWRFLGSEVTPRKVGTSYRRDGN